METPSAPPYNIPPATRQAPPAPHRQAHPTCAAPSDEPTICPACGDTMRLWANYHRCRTCGYKESCCF